VYVSWATKVLRALLENVNGLAVVAGAAWVYVGIRGFSPHAANIVAGALLMATGASPYLIRLYRKRHP
jgi:hypothetical protein